LNNFNYNNQYIKGKTFTSNDEDLSLETLSQDLVNICTALYPDPTTEFILVGHRYIIIIVIFFIYYKKKKKKKKKKNKKKSIII